ncbi:MULTISPECIES: hypothetical protein [Leptolyngbya]|jgi:hypothetical protein|uniref:Uncharacterized protein n=2 Tax=Leptolyngbya boryana TaxID=1184 RepID=A0A1Z4JK18_LEPBY|nr:MULTISPECIES: hypothetical protein [Leptolyngbya]BAY57076.1 hypothetical protein NIES2135_39400 [Leptolyngbya boryana NIES-2135]MBD1857227.1 hypothetical protein [Leptolyngbya sp. FACHB-1624]MBD2367168.1 hypothetical protein [Leptolyngbya sp. FACHB-161]MBD2373478.1 hypothetical protein [Leptolyngbya sp. FACHB-238]MBD2397887.1 hypothetical protein [Leptolyngbya sp. FACHB-239]
MTTAKAIKTSFFGLMSAVLMTAPAFAQNAASVVQQSSQGTEQAGVGNVSVQGNLQTADVTQLSSPVYPYGASINGANVIQGNSQQAGQIGYGNTNIQGNATSATVTQGTPTSPWFPGYPTPGVNGANVVQGSQQGAFQFGGFNSSVQGSATDATVTQH